MAHFKFVVCFLLLYTTQSHVELHNLIRPVINKTSKQICILSSDIVDYNSLIPNFSTSLWEFMKVIGVLRSGGQDIEHGCFKTIWFTLVCHFVLKCLLLHIFTESTSCVNRLQMEICKRKGNRLSWSCRSVQQRAILPEYCLTPLVLSPEDRGQSQFLFFSYSRALGTSLPLLSCQITRAGMLTVSGLDAEFLKNKSPEDGWKNHLSQVA